MPLVTIDTDRLPEGHRTADDLRCIASLLARFTTKFPGVSDALRLIADAMPAPLPTTPGSQVKCHGSEWTLDSRGLWRCHTSLRGHRSPDKLATLGPFEVIRDAGKD